MNEVVPTKESSSKTSKEIKTRYKVFQRVIVRIYQSTQAISSDFNEQMDKIKSMENQIQLLKTKLKQKRFQYEDMQLRKYQFTPQACKLPQQDVEMPSHNFSITLLPRYVRFSLNQRLYHHHVLNNKTYALNEFYPDQDEDTQESIRASWQLPIPPPPPKRTNAFQIENEDSMN